MEKGFMLDLVIIMAAGVVVVYLLHRIRIPSVAGFIVAGALIGPFGLGFIEDAHRVEVLAELGVVLLLFGIGLDLSLDRLSRLWKPILVGGALQLGVTGLGVALLVHALGGNWELAVVVGFMVAVSSTAVVLRGLEARSELEAPHGRLTLGILVFQDLCVVPMLLVLPSLGGGGSGLPESLLALVKAIGVLAAALISSRRLVPWLLRFVARTRQRDLFVLSVSLVCIGTAWLVSTTGMPLAVGAFLAGMVVAGSEFKHQALADIIPFREVFTSLFFVSIGMLLDPEGMIRHHGLILIILAAILLGKFAIIFAVGAVLRLPLRVCILSGALLAQVGEFSFIVSRAARDQGILEDPLAGMLTTAAILSMLLTPLVAGIAPVLAAGVGRNRVLTRLLAVRTPVEDVSARQTGHVIIAGYGVGGREAAQALAVNGFPYVIIDLNIENVHQALAAGEPAYFGDVTSRDVLEHLGVGDAAGMLVVINDPEASVRAIRVARALAPDLVILARCRYVQEVEFLYDAGASVVVPAELQATAEITARLLAAVGAPDGEARKQRERILDSWENQPRDQ